MNPGLQFVSGARALEAALFCHVPSFEVMRRAGVAMAEVAAELLAGGGGDGGGNVLAVAGPGNNGGDALIAAARLREKGFAVTVVFGGEAARLSPDARRALREWEDGGGGGRWLTDFPDDDREFDLMVDGLFGVGLTRGVGGKYAEWIRRMNRAPAKVVAADLPSGLDADTGVAGAATIRADATATFLARKPGLYTADGPDYCGTICFYPLTADEDGKTTLPSDWDAAAPAGGFLATGLSAAEAARLLPRATAHKGGRGSVLLIGGARGMEGALVLAARAAAGLGAGKVFALSLSGRGPAFDGRAPEVMWPAPKDFNRIAAGATAIGIGPGLGQSLAARELLRTALALPAPVVADADALNLIATDAGLQRAAAARGKDGRGMIATPHPAEAGRLLGVGTGEVQANRFAAARALSEKFGGAATVVKGAGSVLHFADGRESGWGVNGSGNAGLARAGAGDVLTGMVAALLAQTGDVAFSLRTGVWLHGAAADALARQHGGPFGWGLDELTPAAGGILNAAGRGFCRAGVEPPPGTFRAGV